MWATVFSIIGASFLLYVPHYVLEVPWLYLVFAAVVYMTYLPEKSEWARQMRLFKWLREKQCPLSFTGRTDILKEKEIARVFGFHPHGVHCVGATLMSTEPTMRHIRVACTYFLFWVPVIKEFCGWGNAFSCDAEHIKANLDSNVPIVIYPGGINEVPGASYMREPEYRLKEGEDESYYVYPRRKGFIRIAMQSEVDIVPCWVDGEYGLFKLYHPFHGLQRLSYKLLRYPWPMISIGWKWLPCIPKPHPVTVWVGTPIPTKRDGDVEEYHKLYHEELAALIERVKASKE